MGNASRRGRDSGCGCCPRARLHHRPAADQPQGLTSVASAFSCRPPEQDAGEQNLLFLEWNLRGLRLRVLGWKRCFFAGDRLA